jgi:hypothetical protein
MFPKTENSMEIQQLPSREMVEQLRGFVFANSWNASQLNTAYQAYKAMGFKYPKNTSCPSCMVDIIKFWRAYITEHGNR